MATADEQRELRRNELQRLGGSAAAIDALLEYGQNHFDSRTIPVRTVFPLADDPHLSDWRDYVSQQAGAPFLFLQSRLPQLCIPIRQGISQTPAYAAVARQGQLFRTEDFDGRLELADPDGFRFWVQEHAAGALPVLIVRHRPDFETLYRALVNRSEPVKLNPAVNAQVIAGFVNWDRVHRYRASWLLHQGNGDNWAAELRRIATTEKWRIHDRFVLLCEHPYSGVTASELGFNGDAATWLEKSTVLRLEHEFTHYLTIRLYNEMRVSLLDETICDWAGMTAAFGFFRGQWFLHFLGLERWPHVRPQGRIHAYRGSLDDDCFELLGALVVQVARALESLTEKYYQPDDRLRFLLALTQLSLECFASERRDSLFAEKYELVAPLVRPS